MRTAEKFAAIIVGVLVLGVLVWEPPPDPPQTAEQQEAVNAQKPEPSGAELGPSTPTETYDTSDQYTELRPSDLTFEEIRNDMKSLTSAQWSALQADIKGTRIGWMGWIENVDKTLLGRNWEVYIDMDPPGDSVSVFDVTFTINPSEALALDIDQPIYFEGTIDRVTNLLGSCSVGIVDVVYTTDLGNAETDVKESFSNGDRGQTDQTYTLSIALLKVEALSYGGTKLSVSVRNDSPFFIEWVHISVELYGIGNQFLEKDRIRAGNLQSGDVVVAEGQFENVSPNQIQYWKLHLDALPYSMKELGEKNFRLVDITR